MYTDEIPIQIKFLSVTCKNNHVYIIENTIPYSLRKWKSDVSVIFNRDGILDRVMIYVYAITCDNGEITITISRRKLEALKSQNRCVCIRECARIYFENT